MNSNIFFYNFNKLTLNIWHNNTSRKYSDIIQVMIKLSEASLPVLYARIFVLYA